METRQLEQNLKWWNIAVAVVHLSSFTALTIISFVRLSSARTLPLWIDFGGSISMLGNVVIFATLLPFPLITGLWHLYEVYDSKQYAQEVLLRGNNKLRWWEYSITNGLMSWSLALLSGANNIFFPILAVLSNFCMQYFGHIHERVNHRLKQPGISWVPLLVGFIPWVMNWVVVLTYFGLRIRNETVFVSDYFAIFGSLFWSLMFVAPLVWRFPKWGVMANYKTERAYILLSLSAKLWLDWVVTIGNLAE